MAAADPTVRRMTAQIAALSRWSKTVDRTKATEGMRRGMRARMEREIDPNGELHPTDLATRVEQAMKAHMLRMSLAAKRKREATA